MLKLLALGAIAAALAEPTTLTLKCKGITNSFVKGQEGPMPTSSFGLIVDLANKTVTGFPWAPSIPITQVTDTRIYFNGWHSIVFEEGHIDRITGDIEGSATTYEGGEKGKAGQASMGGFRFTLTCARTERMF
jgi:hypothetical protein